MLYVVQGLETIERPSFDLVLDVFTSKDAAEQQAATIWEQLKQRNAEWLADFDFKPEEYGREFAPMDGEMIAVKIHELPNMDEVRGFFKARRMEFALKDLVIDKPTVLHV